MVPTLSRQERQHLETLTAEGDDATSYVLRNQFDSSSPVEELRSAKRAFRKGIAQHSMESKKSLERVKVYEWQGKALAGDASAAYRLGRFYERQGSTVPFGEMSHAYELAAQKGHSRAANRLGLLLEFSEPVAACDAVRIARNDIVDAAAPLGRILASVVSPSVLDDLVPHRAQALTVRSGHSGGQNFGPERSTQ